MLNRLGILQSMFGAFDGPNGTARRRQAADVAERWQRLGASRPMMLDLIERGGLMSPAPVQMRAGEPAGPGTKDPYQCGVEDGRRSLALELLTLAGVTNDEFLYLTEEVDEDDDDVLDDGGLD
ncbi:MAG: hypothetical protein AAF582_00125 [Pseudomonadota bacterium]